MKPACPLASYRPSSLLPPTWALAHLLPSVAAGLLLLSDHILAFLFPQVLTHLSPGPQSIWAWLAGRPHPCLPCSQQMALPGPHTWEVSPVPTEGSPLLAGSAVSIPILIPTIISHREGWIRILVGLLSLPPRSPSPSSSQSSF